MRRPGWFTPVRIIGLLTVASYVGSLCLFPFIAGDPVSGEVRHTPGWVVILGGVLAFGTMAGLLLLLRPALVEIWQDVANWLRWRRQLWRDTGSPFASAVEKLRRPRSR